MLETIMECGLARDLIVQNVISLYLIGWPTLTMLLASF